jgi:pyridoxal 5'-phosphate synthase pdxS subunit
MRRLTTLCPEELMAEAKELGAPYQLVQLVAKIGKLPVPNFAAGGVATPADAALCMHLGAEAVFVGSGIFKSSEPERVARAIVEATANYKDFEKLAQCSHGLGHAMKGLDTRSLKPEERLQERGW